MVLQKRLDYGFNGYQVPATPRATRSARRRGAIRKRVDDNSMGAFDLLATIAGKLLLEGESSPASSHTSKDQCAGTKENCLDGDKPLKVEPCDQGSCDRRILVSDHISQGPNQSSCSKESPVHQNESSVMQLPIARRGLLLICWPAPSRIGDRRIRKILASKYWKVAPKLKDDIHSNSYRDQKPNYHNRKNCYKRQRSQMNIPFKKRKLFDRSAVLNIDEGISREGFFDSRGKGITGDASCSKIQGAAMKSSSLAVQQLHSNQGVLTLRIKSFRVPELFIEIPDTATVGSLKKTVMDAVTAVLGGGLCTGISQDNQLDSLGFTLEPNSSQTPPPLCSGDSPCMLPCDVLQPLTRYPAGPTSEASPEPHPASLGNFIETPNPRPFSVAEVEALVQAVEKLGTGRWRDVKLRAFDNAKHRTYDKWKTLVHTARISPQQRRGEPVPQELLDRVLTAHAYWSQQQAKQQLKQPRLAFSSEIELEKGGHMLNKKRFIGF
ncbi:telomere repeat-binding protein 5 isoform X2 [Prunus yedoensis var. nudiflora]|uniref:Telomere repeat-binding protein 5 isoform X2 n=1 Tax=Prunus yedoensis var. nudiflora TaxID=2094558 RepID=A0A314Z2J5_PRUYE|nr:telomere repeat-binding protein 5 isoform X2 [Prunus yedoensis var. nudiflora]